MRIFVAQINPTIGDLDGNTKKIIQSIELGKEKKADLILFPEMSLCGYPPQDFLLLPYFLDALDKKLIEIQNATDNIIAIVGTTRRDKDALFNTAAILQNKKIVGFQNKCLLPTYDVFVERRYFEPSNETKIWNLCGKKIGITICEDIWQQSHLLTTAKYSQNPVEELKQQHPELLLNLSASPFSLTKTETRLSVCSTAAKALGCPLILCNQVGSNDGLIFDGNSVYLDGNGNLLAQAKAFQEDHLLIDLTTKLPRLSVKMETISSLYEALILGIKDYFHKSGFTKACLGLSGGIDSAVVACLAAEALGKQNVLAVSMPSRYTSEASRTDAANLAKCLGIEFIEISIEPPFQSFLEVLSPSFKDLPQDITEENVQSRTRGLILMALSNKLGYIVLSTGNKSEVAMGYATLYGDMCGGLAVINDVNKKQVYALANYINRRNEIIPNNIITRPPSAELKFNQKDSDTLPDYDIIDNVLEAYVEEHRSPEEIAKKWHYPLPLVLDLVKKIHRFEYKRRQSPPGLRVTEKAFSVGRHFPIVQGWI